MDLAYTLITGKIKIGGKFNNDKIDKKEEEERDANCKNCQFLF